MTIERADYDNPSEPCTTCIEGGYPEGECPKSERSCGHHSNSMWVHDECAWCGEEAGVDE